MLLGLIQSLSVSQPPWSQVEQVKQEQAHRSTSSEEKGFPASTQPLPLPKIAVGSVLLPFMCLFCPRHWITMESSIQGLPFPDLFETSLSSLSFATTTTWLYKLVPCIPPISLSSLDFDCALTLPFGLAHLCLSLDSTQKSRFLS